MNKTIALITAMMATATILAQEESDTVQPRNVDIQTTTKSVTEESIDWGNDKSEGRSRLGMSHTKLPGKTKVIKSSTTITKVIDIEQSPSDLLCESDIDLEYYQKDTETEVRTLFSSANCAEFDATYQLRIMYFDATGEIKRIVADEQWPVGLTEQHRTTYPMDPDSELRRVSSRILSCTCRTDQ